MTKVKVELECLKDLLKREPIVKVVNELPAKETADLNYIYVVPKEGEGKDTKAYVLRPDRSGYDTIDLTPQVVSVLGEGYITVEKETLNENGDVTFTVKTNETLANLLASLGTKNDEQDGKLTNLTDRVVALEGKEDKDTIYNDTEVKQGIKANESAIQGVEGDLTALKTHTDSRLTALEEKVDNDTIYDDTELKNRVKALEDKPEPPHEANLFYAKGDIIGIGTETDIRITRDELVNADTIKVGDTVVDHYWDNKVFNTGMFKVVSIEGDNIVLNGINNINYKHPKQELTLTGNELSISEGNSVTLPSGTVYDDSELKGRVTTLENKTDNFVSNVGVSREGNTVKLTYTMVNGDDKEVEFTDNDTVSMAYDDSALRGRIEALEKKPDKDTVYNDTELKEQVNDLGSSVASALHDISEIRVNNEQRLSALESKEDKDKQTLSLEGNTLSISNGNSVELPTAPTAKPVKVSSTSEGVTVTPEEEEGTTNYKVNIDGALSKYYDKSKTYTKNEVDNIITKQEAKATDITVYRGTFANREMVQEGSFDTDASPRITLTYSSSTGVGILKVDFKILKAVGQGAVIANLPKGAPVPAELVEAQVWVGDSYTSIWVDKGANTVRMYATSDPNIFNKRIIINIPGIFKK
jgi:hypothetical protein|nr:MAG TPA: hypothetical protein [Caudoviricetes sp.]